MTRIVTDHERLDALEARIAALEAASQNRRRPAALQGRWSDDEEFQREIIEGCVRIYERGLNKIGRRRADPENGAEREDWIDVPDSALEARLARELEDEL